MCKIRWFAWVGLMVLTACVVRAPNVRQGDRQTATGHASVPQPPPFQSSDEASLTQLALARAQGRALEPAVEWLRAHAAAAGMMPAGPYLLQYFITPAEGWYARASLDWSDAPDGTVALSVVVRDASDWREVPNLTVRAALAPAETAEGVSTEGGERTLTFDWHPLLNRYGGEYAAPAGTRWQVRVDIDAPQFQRHDPRNGDRYASAVSAVFTDITVDRGRLAEPLDESSPELLPLARMQGDAVTAALETMLHGVATDGIDRSDGDYLVAFAVEYAEGYWQMRGTSLEYDTRVEQSAATNAHVEVAVREALTGRFIPGPPVEVTISRAGDAVGTEPAALMWHPWIYHYGANRRVPSGGRYDVRVRATAPSMRRFGRERGRRLASPIDSTFTNVIFRTGQK